MIATFPEALLILLWIYDAFSITSTAFLSHSGDSTLEAVILNETDKFRIYYCGANHRNWWLTRNISFLHEHINELQHTLELEA